MALVGSEDPVLVALREIDMAAMTPEELAEQARRRQQELGRLTPSTCQKRDSSWLVALPKESPPPPSAQVFPPKDVRLSDPPGVE